MVDAAALVCWFSLPAYKFNSRYSYKMDISRWIKLGWLLLYCLVVLLHVVPVNIYLFKVNSRNIRKRYEICLKLTPLSTVSIVNFEQVRVY